jgi:hypothetical protein
MNTSRIFAITLIASALGIGTSALASTPQSVPDQAPKVATVVGAGQVAGVRFETAESASKKEPRIRVAPTGCGGACYDWGDPW